VVLLALLIGVENAHGQTAFNSRLNDTTLVTSGSLLSNTPSGVLPFTPQMRQQDVGSISVAMTNLGSVGDSRVGYDHCDFRPALGAVFPKWRYTTWTGYNLWLGGVKAGDTLVSTAYDWGLFGGVQEIWPAPPPEGLIEERTTRPELNRGRYCARLVHDPAAKSEQDLISVATDTITDGEFTGHNPIDGRKHKPLGIRLTTRSYAWSYDYAQEFVIIEHTVTNIGYRTEARTDSSDRINDLLIGLYFDSFVAHWNPALHPPSPYASERESYSGIMIGRLLTGSILGHPHLPDTLNMIWIAEHDGDPKGGVFDYYSLTEAFGLRVLSPYPSQVTFAFNWATDYQLQDHAWWGPTRRGSKVKFTGSDLGWPRTDRGAYQLMSSGEIDYPVVETAINHESAGWYPPPPQAVDIADGDRPEGLFSFGPYDLDYGDSITFAIAIVGGENFHTDPTHFERTFDPSDPKPYMDGLDFSDLIRNSQQAAWLYDSPGVDTDNDGYRGEFMLSGLDTIWYRGDGVPDFAGPPPPPPPPMIITTREGQVTIRFNGRRSETDLDPYSHRVDFEGYRVYMSRTGRLEGYAMLAQRDLINYARFAWNRNTQKWEMKTPPYALDSLKRLYDSECLVRYGHPFHPDSFGVKLVEKAFLHEVLDEKDPSRLDTFFYAFDRYEANLVADDQVLAQTVEAGYEVTGVIRKVYPESIITDTFYREDGTVYLPYYEYEYVAKDLNVAEPIFFAVTAFDHGDPASALAPLESSPTANTQDIWPINSAEVIKTERPKPGVYPNPYRMSDYYNTQGWENPRGLEPDPERARKVTFFNVPDTCVVSIWSIDGDLVRRLEHRENPSSSDASVVIWNLITRNTQAVKTGIYLYSIESRFGVDTGKLVIIK
jgi:hypothetical protein